MQGAVLPKAQEMPVPKISTIKNVLSIGIFLAVVCYSAIYANNTFPISEGWNVNYVELIWHGKVPYRDFYYYLPPLNLLVDAVLWKLSFGSLLLYRLWWLLQRATIFTLLFRLISRYINVVSTFVACLFSVMLCASSVYDLLGDYNQTVALLSILLLYCVIGFQEADTSKQRYTKIFGAGFMLGLVFLNKQTIFLASGIVYFAALAFYCIRKKDARFGWYCLFVVAGAVIPLAVAAAYLLANGAFFPFVEQVFMHTGGKGSIFTILFGGLSMALLKVQNWLIAVAAVLLAVNTGVSASREKALRAQSLLFPLLLLLLYVNFEKEISSFLELLGKSPEMQAILLIDAVLTALLLYLCVKRKVRGSRVMLPAGSILLLFLYATLFLLIVSSLGLIVSNYSATMQQAALLMFFFLVIFILMSGMLTPVSAMPEWAQLITYVNPLRYFIEVLRALYLKGSGFADLQMQFFAMLAYAAVSWTWAICSYKKSA